MGDNNNIKKVERITNDYQAVDFRVNHFNEFSILLDKEKQSEQADRCMDCGVSFCQSGCPIDNNIPDFNSAVAQGNWSEAYNILNQTNNFPEFTGRLCPAPCESSCVLGINNGAVAIKNIEQQIIEYAFDNNLVGYNTKSFPTTKKIAVVGSGPAGLAAADELNSMGHYVSVFEKSDAIGGLIRYGIPDFKIEKKIIDRRVELMESQGIRFFTSYDVGAEIPTEGFIQQFDAVVLACGSSVPRDINVEGRSGSGIYFAMDYLEQSNRIVSGNVMDLTEKIDVEGKRVVVIGGGDTGADCVGTSVRRQAKSILQLEILNKPPENRNPLTPWPLWPDQLRTSTSHLEGCNREWALSTKSFERNDKGELVGINVVKVEWKKDKSGFSEMVDTEEFVPCDIVFIAAGFIHPKKKGPIADLNLTLDTRGNVKTNNYQTSFPNVFAAGDMRMGQSLVVWAIAEGRKVASAVNKHLAVEKRNCVVRKLYSKI